MHIYQLEQTYLKKSFRQNNFPSLEKHLSVSEDLQSEHCTHLACQALSKTLSKNRSKIGRSHPAQCTIADFRPTATMEVECIQSTIKVFQLIN